MVNRGALSVEQKKMIGERLAKVRIALGKRRQDWQREYNIGLSKLSQWESGVCSPDLAVVMQICNDYEVSLDYIFRGVKRGRVLID